MICFQTLLLLPLIHNSLTQNIFLPTVVICFQTLLLLPLIHNLWRIFDSLVRCCDLLSNIALITFDTQLYYHSYLQWHVVICFQTLLLLPLIHNGLISLVACSPGCDLLSNIALITFDTQPLCLNPLLTRYFNVFQEQ